ncbi:NTF2-like domain [Phytophthora cactorum]|nr:NTF2-like domain [Phytophthora cactorum]
MTRAHSNSRVNKAAAAAALRQNSNSSVGRRTRSRHGGSISSNASFLSVSNQKPEVAVDVRHSGYLMIKRGLLKVTDKRFYFVARRHPELYSCKDETSFSLWLASGHPLAPHGGGDAIAKASGLSPVLVGTVLRADGSSEEGGSNQSDKVFTVMIGSASKCITLRLAAESSEKATQWLEALQEVQVTKREGGRHASKLGSAMDKRMLLSLNEHNALRGADSIEKSTSDHGDTEVENVAGEVASDDSEPVVSRPTSTSNAKMPRVYAGGKLQSKPRTEDDEATAVSTPSSQAGSSPTSTTEQADHPVAPASTASAPPSRLHRMDSVTSSSSTTSGQSQSSTMAMCFSLCPATNGETIEWRYGIPEYVLTDLAYVRGRLREPDTTPLASYVEECCQTFIMEATHKARYDQWRSVVQESFYLQVNDGIQVLGSSILENDMLGLLYLGDADATMSADHGDSDESQDPRAELAEAFPDGFPMEVLDVFTQPPQCYFSWRHWGPFTGKYRGVKGDGSKVEVRGFGEMTVDASRMRSLRLFFKQKDLVSGLRQVTDRVARARRDTATISALNAGPGRTVRATSAAVAPAPLVVPQFDDDDDSSSSDDELAIESLNKKQYTSGSSNNNDEDHHDESAGEFSRGQLHQTFRGEIQWDRVQELQELTNANATLTSEARDLRQQVKALQIQLEAQAPVPGLDVDAVQDILLEKDNLDHVSPVWFAALIFSKACSMRCLCLQDVRDVKIVHQAKTLRTLKRSLQREKQLAADAAKQSQALETANKQLEEEVDTLKLKLQRFQARAAAEKINNNGAVTQPQRPESPTESRSDTGNDGGSLQNLCDELKSKNTTLQQELKKTQRALVREVGDDVSLEEITGNTDSTVSGASRRGRAQQIFMLKAKVKKLQTRLATMRPGTTSTETHDSGNVLDVDQRAQQDLSGQQMHRQKLLDQLTSQRDELQERLHRLTRKYDAIKARAHILDREKHETRDKFQVLVDKSRTDDALVDALQRQLETWKTKLHEARRARTADGTKSASQEERAELERLRKIVAEHKSRGGDRTTNGAMPQPSEVSQYRAIAVEKERLTEVVRSLKCQLEDKDKQFRNLQESHSNSDLAPQTPMQAAPPSPSLPPIGDEGVSRLPVSLYQLSVCHLVLYSLVS